MRLTRDSATLATAATSLFGGRCACPPQPVSVSVSLQKEASRWRPARFESLAALLFYQGAGGPAQASQGSASDIIQ